MMVVAELPTRQVSHTKKENIYLGGILVLEIYQIARLDIVRVACWQILSRCSTADTQRGTVQDVVASCEHISNALGTVYAPAIYQKGRKLCEYQQNCLEDIV